jgi:pimeloyl-ACP methyl ester carboxylesterase
MKTMQMKPLQWLATVALVMAGVVLLIRPVSGQVAAKDAAYVPTRFTVVDAGTLGKPDVVLIPGLASSRAVWDAEVPLLAPNYRLHLVQVDGFAGAAAGANAGASDAAPMLPAIVEQLHRYIAALGMRPVVVGHSLGGLLTLMLAEKYPGDVRKIVIVDTLPYYGQVFNPTATIETVKPMAEAMKTQMLAMPADQYAAMQPMMAAQMVKDPAAQKMVAASSLASNREVVMEAMIEDLETDLRPEVAKIKVPTLVLYEYDSGSTQDPMKFEAMMQESYKPVPNVTLKKVEGSRHFIMYDQPAKFDAALEGFLK